eukprot:2721553-Pyramimonas_sp.AAC.1
MEGVYSRISFGCYRLLSLGAPCVQIGFTTRSYSTLGYVFQITQGSMPDGVYAGSEEAMDVFDVLSNSVSVSALSLLG